MDDDERVVQRDPGLGQEHVAHVPHRFGWDAEREVLVAGAQAHVSDQVELSSHLVAGGRVRLGFRHPGREQLVGVLPAMRQPARDVGVVAG